jgi:hypothetical protein
MSKPDQMGFGAARSVRVVGAIARRSLCPRGTAMPVKYKAISLEQTPDFDDKLSDFCNSDGWRVISAMPFEVKHVRDPGITVFWRLILERE